ncbi:MAG TPA: restriction endonuclease subunit S [Candidatus Lachnoclostridium pullistercoris]|uniref:Restriction endonuclease subunit S n=1 Tax=Candidatus Lachnoclostridium pullistercoris TaxID=2838632 RepID=A0A9D2T5K5_9FIRM|nr:restriction endonuclease subunit S [Candidatus Lachnoclostridium pullistercoris]
MNKPLLRFPEFSDSGPWEPFPFGKLAALKTDKFSPAQASEPLPCIELEHLEQGTGRILKTVASAPSMTVKNRFCAGDVLFGKLRPGLRKFARPDFSGVCSQEIWVLSGLLAENGFLYQLIQTDRFFRAAMETTGSRMPRADWKTIAGTAFFIPPLREQQYLSRFLSAADDEINARRLVIDDLRRQREGILQQLFLPAAPACSDLSARRPWRLLPLSAVLTERREYAKKGGAYPHVSLTKEGVIPKTARYNRDFLVKTEEKAYKITRLDDICYNPANLKFGVICRNRLGDGIFSPIYVTFSVNPGFDPAFVELSVTRPSFLLRALRYQEGTVYERMAVRPQALLSLQIAVPPPAIQQQIARTAGCLDRQIQAEETVLADLCRRKKGLLQEVLM